MNNKENGNVLVIWIKKYWFFIFVIVLCTIKQLMVTNLPVFARDAGGPDQYKLLIDAEMLFDGTYYTDSTYDIFTLFRPPWGQVPTWYT